MDKKGTLLCAVSICAMSLFMSGCTSDEEKMQELSDVQSPKEEMVPVSTFTELPFDLSEADWTFAGQSAFHYIERKWNTEKEHMDMGLYTWNEKSSSPKRLTEDEDREDFIQFSFTDKEESIFTFGYEEIEGIYNYFLRKTGADGTGLWKAWLDKDVISSLDGFNIMGGAAENGTICLYDRFGNLYFFDQQVKLITKINILKEIQTINEADNEFQLISTGAGEVYGYFFCKDSRFIDNLVYFQVDMKERTIREKMNFIPENGFAVKELWRGRGNTVLYTDEETIWELQMENGTEIPILDLNSEYVNINGSFIKAVSMPGTESLYVYCYDPQMGISECCVITDQDKDTLEAKETVTIGLSKDDFTKNVKQYVKRFNRQSDKWNVKIIDYFSLSKRYDNYSDEFVLDILRGNAPDILDVKNIPFEIIEDKDIFESLEPYFRNSDAVRQEDLLPSVWRSGCLNEEMTFVMPWFRLETCMLKKEMLTGRSWNLETFMELMDSYPDSQMFNFITLRKRSKLIEFVLDSNSSDFYNVVKKECYFTEDMFRNLLERIKMVEEETGNASPFTTYKSDIESLMDGDVLIFEKSIGNMETFLSAQRDTADTVLMAGYPWEEGEYHKFNTEVLLGINSKSNNKEGAWAFLEYLISEESQNRISNTMYAFPVRTNSFEKLIANGSAKDEQDNMVYATEEECSLFRKMVDNAYLKANRMFDPVCNIVQEESQSYFSDEKSLEEVTEIIQNRVMLYLSE